MDPQQESVCDVSKIRPAPWNRCNWAGNLVSVDGCSTADFTADDVERVVWWARTDETDWDGDTAGVVQLRDRRFVAWEASWSPTGDGFCRDGRGGTADIFFAQTQAGAEAFLSAQAKGLPRWPRTYAPHKEDR